MPASTAWTPTTLGQLGRYLNGRGFKKSEWSDRGRPIIRIQNLTGSSDVVNRFVGEVDDRHVVRAGDLLVSWAATLGAYVWTGEEGVLNQHIFKVESFINPRFHKYLLDYKLAELMRHTHGSGMVHITRSNFDNVPVAVPDRGEQRQIVDILEDHLSRLDAADGYVDASVRRLRGLEEQLVLSHVLPADGAGAQSVWQAAEGTLSPLPDGWRWLVLDDVAEVVGGVTKDAKRQADPSFVEVPYLRVANVQRARLDLAFVTTIRVARERADQLRLLPGDVLMNEGGDRDKLARGWVWGGEVEGCIHQNHVFRARPNKATVRPEWLAWCANTYGARWAQRHGRQSVNLASISLSTIRRMPIPVPPLAAQDSALEAIGAGRAAIDDLGASLEATALRSRSLRRALLAAAFSGRLTGHASDMDRAEELAS